MLKPSAIKNGSVSALLLIMGTLYLSVFTHAKNQSELNQASSEPLSEKEVRNLVSVSEDQKSITLPLRVFIIKDIELEKAKQRVKMDTWITPKDVESRILPEINRIWKPAGIQWVLESILVQSAADLENKEEHIQYVQNSVREDRDAKNKRFPERTKKITELCGKKNKHPNIHNLYFFPYLGQTYQGFASMRGNTAYLGVWTDKHTRGQKIEKALITEREPMKRGSLGRTAAHELGHNLGLIHPNKSNQKIFNRIMGGRKQGYELTPEEIKTARAIALKRAKTILAK